MKLANWIMICSVNCKKINELFTTFKSYLVHDKFTYLASRPACINLIPIVADSGFFKNFLYQVGCLSLAETTNWAESGKHQFGSEPYEILNLRSSTTPETVAFTPP